jgi:transcriptional regulator with PAS, ATPase and Fis domain
LVTLNCAGIPETLLEAELFGYERGAFTGAVQRKIGRYELADEGTLFLDEIGELQPNLQAKILRLLENGEFQRLGGLETLTADVRLISATHRRLEREITEGRFREDLYYRLAVFKVQLPPLRERTGDIAKLAKHFLMEQSEAENRIFEGIDTQAMELLQRHDYPGNVRELHNIIAHAVVTSKGPYVTISDLPKDFLRSVVGKIDPVPGSSQAPLLMDTSPETVFPAQRGKEMSPMSFPTLKDIEKRHVSLALETSGWNKSEAARMLGINRVTLYRKIRDYDLF